MINSLDIENYGLAENLFKITNFNFSEEIKRIKENPKKVTNITGLRHKPDSFIIIICYRNKANEVYFFKSYKTGRQYLTRLRGAMGYRV